MIAASSSPSQETKLESWKEIAAYLNRDARTVRRWEQSEGLPVHRHRHLTRSSVYAFPSELDAWRGNRKAEARLPEVRTLSVWRRSLILVPMMVLALATASSGRAVALRDQSSALSSRLVWTVPGDTQFARTISPDERLVACVDSSGALVVRDLRTNRDVRLTPERKLGDQTPRAWHPAFSRNGKQIAYSTSRPNELRVIDVEAASPTPRTVYANPETPEIYPYDWTPDGKRIAVMIVRSDRTIQVGLVSTDDGKLVVLKSMLWRTAGHMALSPDGRWLAVDLPESEATRKRDVYLLDTDGARESHVVQRPGRDVLVGWSPDGGHIVVESDRDGRSGIWAVPVANGRTTGSPVLLKTDLGTFSPLGITRSGKLFYRVRTFPRFTVKTAALDQTARTIGDAIDIDDDPRAMTMSPDYSRDGKSIAYLSQHHSVAGELPAASNRITVRALESGQVQRQLNLVPELEFISQMRWSPDGRMFAVAGRNMDGRYGVFTVDASTGATKSIVLSDPGPATVGAPVWSPDSRKIYFFRRAKPLTRDRTIVERDLATGKNRDLYRHDPMMSLEISPDGRHLVSAIVDAEAKPGQKTIVVVSSTDGSARELLVPGNAPIAMGWLPDNSAFFVRNWANNAQHLWLVPVEGGDPVRFGEGRSQLQVHAGGRRVAFEAPPPDGSSKPDEVWVLENFLPGVKR